jgi:predicted phage tail component-like protein
MQRLPYLYYKGKNSLEFSLYIKSKGTYNAAERDFEFVSVPGRNGDLIQDNGRYKNVSIPYELALLKKDARTFSDLADSIKDWLSVGGGYNVLWDSYNPRYFRYAAVEGGVDIAEELTNYGEMSLTFNCKPYRYSFDGQKTITIRQSSTQIYNPEKLTAAPYIRIYGNGNITLSVNAVTNTFTGVSGYVEIDSEIMNAYKGLTPLNNIMTGDTFPTFAPGANTITITGNATKAEIVPRWCTI